MTYAAGVVKGAKQPDQAREFVDGLTDGGCADALAQADSSSRSAPLPVLLALALAAALTFLTLPVVAIFVDSTPAELIDSLGEPGALDALWLSLGRPRSRS